MTVGTAYRSGQAAKVLGVSAHALRRLAEAGLVDAEYTGSQWRFPVEEIERLQREGLPPLPAIDDDSRSPGGKSPRDNRAETEGLLAPPSAELIADAEDLERQKLKLQKLGVRRQIEEEMDFFRGRDQEEEDRQDQRRTRLQEQRHRQRRQQAQLLDQQRRQQWQSRWIEYALRSLPYDAPEETKLQVHQQVIETLAKLNPGESRRVIEQLVDAATEKGLRPWRRQQEIQKVIEDALPYEIKYSDEKPRALRAAAEAISKLRPEATREELELAAKEAIEPFVIKHQRMMAAREHQTQCDWMVCHVVIGFRHETSEVLNLAKQAVSKALRQLPVGCSKKVMERARDQALVPIKKAIAKREEAAEALRKKQQEEARRKREAEEAKLKKQQEETQRKREAEEAVRRAESRLLWKLGHVDDYLQELEKSRIEFEDIFDRLRVARKLQEKIKPTLVKELVSKPDLTDEQLHKRIEQLVDEHLPEELDEDLEVEEP